MSKEPPLDVHSNLNLDRKHSSAAGMREKVRQQATGEHQGQGQIQNQCDVHIDNSFDVASQKLDSVRLSIKAGKLQNIQYMSNIGPEATTPTNEEIVSPDINPSSRLLATQSIGSIQMMSPINPTP